MEPGIETAAGSGVAEAAPGHSCRRKIPLTSQPSETRLPSARMSGERSASEPLGMQVSARYLFRQRRCSLERFSALQASLQTVTTCRPRVYLSMRCGNHTCATQPASCLASHTSTGSPYQNAQENYRAELVPVRWLVGEALSSRPAVCPVPPGPPACSERGSIRRTRPPAAWAAWRTMQRKSRRVDHSMMPPAILSDVRPGMSIDADGLCGASAWPPQRMLQ